MDIEHDVAGQRFVALLDGGEAVLAYELQSGGVLDLYSTYVPPFARGRGIAARLLQVALDHARAAGYRIIPSCSYVATWLKAHPEQADLIDR